jgi:hypothetical protein
MKALLVALATTLLSPQGGAEAVIDGQLTDSFTDVVQSITEEGKSLIVSFLRHGALYKIGYDHPQFAEIKTKLEKAQKIDQKLKVVAIIPSMTIREIKG